MKKLNLKLKPLQKETKRKERKLTWRRKLNLEKKPNPIKKLYFDKKTKSIENETKPGE